MMSDDRKIVKCKGCGADIFFENGVPWWAKKVPVLVAQGFIVHRPEGAAMEQSEKKVMGYVSHFINCPAASSFSGKGKRDAAHQPRP
jgi:hypothetical protein